MTVKKLEFQDFSSKKLPGKSNINIITKDSKNFLVFGKEEESEPKEYTKTQIKSETDAAYQKGLQEGKDAGRKEIESTVLNIQQEVRQGMQTMLLNIEERLGQVEEEKNEFIKNMAELMQQALNKAVSNKVAENSGDIISDMLNKLANQISVQKEVIITCSEQIKEQIEKDVQKVVSENNIKTKIEISGDASLPASNLKIEWGKTGIIIDSENKMNEINEIIDEYIKSL